MIDVADAARVSLKTVSRVVNGEPGVSHATSERVNAAITALGYQRNALARALRPGQDSHTLGLVIGDVTNPFYSAIARGVEEAVRGRGLLVIAGSSDDDPERERTLVQLLCERRVDGLLVVPAADDHRYLLPEVRVGTPVVFLDRPPRHFDADTILLDNVGGARAAVEHLLAGGHRRIGVIGDAPHIYTALERLRGYRDALAVHGIPFDEELVRLGCHDAASAELAARELLALSSPPTALFTANNRITTGALRATWGRRRPVALVGFDDLELGELLLVPVTVVAYDAAELGRRGAEVLCRRLDGYAGPPERQVLPTGLVTRGSGELAA